MQNVVMLLLLVLEIIHRGGNRLSTVRTFIFFFFKSVEGLASFNKNNRVVVFLVLKPEVSDRDLTGRSREEK